MFIALKNAKFDYNDPLEFILSESQRKIKTHARNRFQN